ncbi:MICOS complex subunit MIC13 homolog QIL1 [Harmonia axyridis]|uniref:MICOS complex subunit MIC13 homolog QIL1 n=1 Tax=Harmonia axyridis TaxID=115357 RepID=UPI001E277C9A|nr:MICOS complex subunit MIC13 homolog QIL1 [Harmonia axyridis]
MGLISFAVKLGVAGTAIYYMKKEGLWDDSEVSLKALDRLKEVSQPHLEQIKAQVPLDLPKLPETEQMHQMVGVYWNRGILATFDFLQHLPTHVSNWTDKGMDMALKNEEVKKLIENFKLSEAPKQQ